MKALVTLIKVLFFIILIIQIIYGAFTAGYVNGNASKIRPGHIFNTWPKMGEDWFPEQITMKNTFFENILENPSGIQFMHRTLAVLIVIFICLIWYKSTKLKLSKNFKYGVS